jgi:hypothetical protein
MSKNRRNGSDQTRDAENYQYIYSDVGRLFERLPDLVAVREDKRHSGADFRGSREDCERFAARRNHAR